MLHLVSNALHACARGGHIAVRLCDMDGGCCLTVTDDGCGLPSGEQWVENGRRFLGGARAGLKLCRAYCHCVGWTLSLTPKPTGGVEAALAIPPKDPQNLSADVRLRMEDRTEFDRLRWMLLRELHLLRKV